MDRVYIKETAKNLLKKNHWLCVGVALIVALLGGASSTGSFSTGFNFSINNPTSTETPDFRVDDLPITDAKEFLTVGIIFVIVFIVTLTITFLIKAFLTNQIKVGSCRFFLKYRKNNPVEVGEIFQSYKDKTFLNVAKATFMRDLFVFLWSTLCVIPGIIKGYEYAAVDYILSLNPTIDYQTALDLSKRIMNGHKLELFELHISFLGWNILSVFTCGLLGIFYVNPYVLLSEAEFFAFVRENAIMNGVISAYDIPDYNEYVPAYMNYNLQEFGFNNPNYQGFNTGYTTPDNLNNAFQGCSTENADNNTTPINNITDNFSDTTKEHNDDNNLTEAEESENAEEAVQSSGEAEE